MIRKKPIFDDGLFPGDEDFAAGLPKPVAGIDEAGRGPLAGPVIAAAVILDPARPIAGLADSKTLSAKRREALYCEIMTKAAVGIGEASTAEIDSVNILQATFLAMRRATAALGKTPAAALVDGNRDPKLGFRTRLVVKGDARVPCIAAASIVAKVTRDEIMKKLHLEWPDYGWDKNAGYGVSTHLKAINLVGITPHHRKTFAPISRLVSEKNFITD